ncbi:S1C family serine protease [Agilicoccus flavus]|uniref:S1C family serine protease n=1 Tax=Agilicoccus flavus TaxID=2775968 RepID=UPI001CF6A692|nr:trypsin-like peptidase domain-containing protein [Agilicoccus flavus]
MATLFRGDTHRATDTTTTHPEGTDPVTGGRTAFGPSASDGRDPAAPAGPSGRSARPRGRRWAELVAAAAIAALVSTGTTLAVTSDDPATGAGTTASAGTAAALTSAGASPSGSGVDWSKVAAATSPGVVAIGVTTAQGSGEGSGVVWDAQGNIVTNNHVVAGAGQGAKIEVRIGAQKSYAATVVGTDPTTDLAVIRLTDPPQDLTPVTRASAGSVAVGDPVMALGNPLGLAGTATTGIVSALDRPVTTQVASANENSAFAPDTNGSGEVVTAAIQTSAAINPGNSGGALVDASGRLVGINSSIAQLSAGQSPYGSQQESGNIGIGFAIPVGEVSTIVGQLISSGSAKHATVGIGVADAEVASDGATVSGAGIRSVTAGSPAASAGLKVGQVVTAVDGRPVDSADGLVGRIRGLAVGQKVTLTLMDSAGATSEVAVTLGSGSR